MQQKSKSEELQSSTFEADIGRRLKLIRRSKSFTINKLARMAGVSAGMISQIERNMANPSLRILEQLRQVLDVPLTAFLENNDLTPSSSRIETLVRRHNDRPHFHVGKEGVTKELLSPNGDHDLQFMMIDVPPHSRSEEVLIGIGEKAGLLLTGQMTLHVAGENIIIFSGDSFQFKSHLSHYIYNHTDEHVKLLWIMHIKPNEHL